MSAQISVLHWGKDRKVIPAVFLYFFFCLFVCFLPQIKSCSCRFFKQYSFVQVTVGFIHAFWLILLRETGGLHLLSLSSPHLNFFAHLHWEGLGIWTSLQPPSYTRQDMAGLDLQGLFVWLQHWANLNSLLRHCSHPDCTGMSVKLENVLSFHSWGWEMVYVTFSASAFHFLIVSSHADNPTRSQSASFLCITKALHGLGPWRENSLPSSQPWLLFSLGSCVSHWTSTICQEIRVWILLR